MSSVVSVVVCTYNRADLLETILRSLCAQTLGPSEYEVIVIDNNSTDATRDVTASFCADHPNIHYCFEPRQGLSHARNRGWQEARGNYVGYIDDDAKAPEQWLELAKEIIEQISPDVFGGPYFAFYRTPKPQWFKDSYGSRDLGNEARVLTEHEYLCGGNIFFLRSLLENQGGFDTSLGMVGDAIAYGEETALLRRIHGTVEGVIVYYDPALYVYHLVRARKTTLRWNMRQRFARGRYSYQVFQVDSRSVGSLRLARWATLTLCRFGIDLVYGVLARDRTRYPFVQNYWYERAFERLRTLGAIYERYQERRGLQK